jgi:hypothetical protein
MSFQRSLALLLVLNAHFSLCAGGLLNVSAAFAASVTAPVTLEGPMSVDQPQSMILCMSDGEESTEEKEEPSVPGCSGDGNSCIRESARDTISRLILVIAQGLAGEIAIVQPIEIPEISDDPTLERSRSGPLAWNTGYFLGSTVIRE